MNKLVYISIFVAVLTSGCLKKVEGVDTLNSNIYDKEYAGGSWFSITDAYEFQNSLGQDLVHLTATVPDTATPGLKQSLLYTSVLLNEEDEYLLNAPVEEDGSYEFVVVGPMELDGSYCLTMGVYIEEDSTFINHFTECVNL